LQVFWLETIVSYIETLELRENYENVFEEISTFKLRMINSIVLDIVTTLPSIK